MLWQLAHSFVEVVPLMDSGRKLTLPFIADDLLPKYAAECSALTGEAISRSQRLQHLVSDLDLEDKKDDAELEQLYQVVDRLRVGAKDVQNLVDRSLSLSHMFVPVIESAYPCTGAEEAVNLAHGTHLGIGRAKEVVGSASGDGVADILARMERGIGRHASMRPGGLHPMLPPSQACMQHLLLLHSWSHHFSIRRHNILSRLSGQRRDHSKFAQFL